MRFEAGERRMGFTAEDYLPSFAMPNFYFHAVTAYDSLRNPGITVGKVDFLGQVRQKSWTSCLKRQRPGCALIRAFVHAGAYTPAFSQQHYRRNFLIRLDASVTPLA